MKELSVGEQLVGRTFNPNNDAVVDHIKSLYEGIIDTLTQHGLRSTNTQTAAIYNQATLEAITAQMWAVKAVTWVEPPVVHSDAEGAKGNDAG